MLEQAHIFTSRGKQLVAIEHSPFLLNENEKINQENSRGTQGVIIVVGGPQTRVGSHRMFVLLSRALAKKGLHVFRFDYTGAGDSEGDVMPFTDIQTDISAAILYFKQQQPQLTQLSLWGLCDAASAILLYLAQYTQKSIKIHNLVLVNPWVKQTHTNAQVYLKSYYLKRLFSQHFWKKLFTGQINTRNSLNDVQGFRKQSKKSVDNNSFVNQMHQGLSSFQGNSHIILSGNDLTADEYRLLVKNNRDWQLLVARGNVTTENIDSANHTFSAHQSQKTLIESTVKALLLR